MKTRPIESTTAYGVRGRAREAAIEAPSRSHRSPPIDAGSSFARLMTTLAERVDRGERDITRTTSLRGPADPLQLLALQAGMYRYVEAVDLATKLIDRAVNVVKTTLQGQ